MFSSIRRFFRIASWVILFTFAGPTVLIMASWNAVPGGQMYPVKRGLENVLLAIVGPSRAAKGNIQIQYTKRRLSEVQTLIASDQSGQNTANANAGLSNLREQVNDTTQTIKQVESPEQQRALAQQYLVTLRETQKSLAQERQKISGEVATPPPGTQPTATSIPTATPPPGTTTTLTAPTTQPTPAPALAAPMPPTSVVVTEIDETQNSIEAQIIEIEQLVSTRTLPEQSRGVGEPGGGRNNRDNNRDGGRGRE